MMKQVGLYSGEVFGSNLNRVAGYLTDILRGFRQFLQAIARVMTSNKLRTPRFKCARAQYRHHFFPRCSPIISFIELQD